MSRVDNRSDSIVAALPFPGTDVHEQSSQKKEKAAAHQHPINYVTNNEQGLSEKPSAAAPRLNEDADEPGEDSARCQERDVANINESN